MVPFINFRLVPVQFGRIADDIASAMVRYLADDTTLSWIGIIVALIGVTLIVRTRIAFLSPNRTVSIFVASFSPFLVMGATLLSLADAPLNPLVLALHGGASFWLAMSLLRMPLLLLDVRHKRPFYAAVAFFALSGSVLLFRQLAEIASYDLYSGAVSLFAVLGIISKLGILTGMYLYGRMLFPALLERLAPHVPGGFTSDLLRPILRTGFGIFALLWLGNYIVLSQKLLMLVFIAALLIWVYVGIQRRIPRIAPLVYDPAHYSVAETQQIVYNLKKGVFLALLFLFFGLASLFNEGTQAKAALDSVYLIKTALLDLSLWQLLFAVLVFNLLYSALIVLTKRMRLLPSFRDSISIKSAEALVLNLGLLLILILSIIQMGVSWQVFVPVAGALGIGIGFGLQTILNNYMSGFIVLFAQKLRIGDIVELPGNAGSAVGNTGSTIVGSVEAIDILSTTLKTADGIEISIPNSFFIAEKIINYTQTSPYVRVKIAVGVDYATDLELAERLIVEAMGECDEIEQGMEKGVMFIQYGASSLDLAPYFWINIRKTRGLGPVKSDLLGRILTKFRTHGISIPFPQSEITLRTPIPLSKEHHP